MPADEPVNVVTRVAQAAADFTVSSRVAVSALQILVTRYLMVAVPGARPVTTPEALTVAIALLLLLQVPPGVALSICIVSLWHTVSAPVIRPASAIGFTITLVVVVAEPQTLVTV